MNPPRESALAEVTPRADAPTAGAPVDAQPAVTPPMPEDLATANPKWRRRSRPSGEAALHHPGLDEAAKLRLGLQRRAHINLRRHIRRDLVRISVLVGADLAVFVLVRGIVRAIRDHGMLGAAPASLMSELLPRGILGGAQFGLALLLGLFVTGNYGEGDARRDPGRLLRGAALAAALPLWLQLWNLGPQVVLPWYAVTTTIMWMGLVAVRMTIDRIVALVRPPERDALATLLVGSAKECRAAMTMRLFNGKGEFRVIGAVEASMARGNGALGGVEDLPRIIHERRAEAVVICGSLGQQAYDQVVDAALSGGCELAAIPRSANAVAVRPTLVWRDGEPVVILAAPALKAQQLMIKRVVDLVGAGLGLLMLSPVLLAVAAMIKLDSRGPVLFRQQRVGLGGRPFGMFKFRTMVADADQKKADLAHLNQTGDPRLFKIKDDPRITRVGRWMRRWSIDEIPQLLNVMTGDMSLVGPRPFFLGDLAQYEAHHFDRLGASPGMTGLWQVSGRSAVTDFEEVVRLDRDYIERWSILLDLKILVMTLPAVLKRTGAF
jgi:exopolysaccharide biosynthesis polyprenyl glycosylphosphotransferase